MILFSLSIIFIAFCDLMNYFNSLNDLFPDTEDELENRHSSHLGDLKKRFTKTYGGEVCF